MPAVAASASRWAKVLVAITEDWFALSHFVPLIGELQALASSVVVATRSSGRLGEIERLGVRTRPFDMHRGSLNAALIKQVRDGLADLIDEERPDAVHAIAMQPMIMTSLALAKARHRPSAVILHLTGQGYLGSSRSPVAYLLRPLARTALRHCAARHATWLVAENNDDVGRMIRDRVAVPGRTAVVPGAGVDLSRYPELPVPCNPTAKVAFVGRMLEIQGPAGAGGRPSPAAGARGSHRPCAVRRCRQRQPRSHPQGDAGGLERGSRRHLARPDRRYRRGLARGGHGGRAGARR